MLTLEAREQEHADVVTAGPVPDIHQSFYGTVSTPELRVMHIPGIGEPSEPGIHVISDSTFKKKENTVYAGHLPLVHARNYPPSVRSIRMLAPSFSTTKDLVKKEVKESNGPVVVSYKGGDDLSEDYRIDAKPTTQGEVDYGVCPERDSINRVTSEAVEELAEEGFEVFEQRTCRGLQELLARKIQEFMQDESNVETVSAVRLVEATPLHSPANKKDNPVWHDLVRVNLNSLVPIFKRAYSHHHEGFIYDASDPFWQWLQQTTGWTVVDISPDNYVENMVRIQTIKNQEVVTGTATQGHYEKVDAADDADAAAFQEFSQQSIETFARVLSSP